MRFIFISIIAALALTSCGSGGGGGSNGGGSTPPPAPTSTVVYGDIFAPFTAGIFVGTETDTQITVYSGARLGEVTFTSHTLSMDITGRNGDNFRSLDGTKLFVINYDALAQTLEIRRVAGSDMAHWKIVPALPAASG